MMLVNMFLLAYGISDTPELLTVAPLTDATDCLREESNDPRTEGYPPQPLLFLIWMREVVPKRRTLTAVDCKEPDILIFY